MAFDVDYVNNGSRNEKVIQENVNLSFDPATGEPLSVLETRATRPYPLLRRHLGDSVHGLVRLPRGCRPSFTKRFSDNWQASVTYTLSRSVERDSDDRSAARRSSTSPCRRSRRRVHPGGDGSAAPPGVQRHLASRRRLPGERRLLLRLGRAIRRFRRVTCTAMSAPGRTSGIATDGTIVPRIQLRGRSDPPGRHAAPAAHSAGGADCTSTASSRCSTCSTERTTVPTFSMRPAVRSSTRRKTRTLRTRHGHCSSDSGWRSRPYIHDVRVPSAATDGAWDADVMT